MRTLSLIQCATCHARAGRRFTDEIFAGLISLIFTISAILDLVKVHTEGSEQMCSAVGQSGLLQNMSKSDLISILDETMPDAKKLPCTTLLELEAKTLVSVVLALGTYMIAMALRAARRSQYTKPWIRNFLADFGVAISIFVMVLVHESGSRHQYYWRVEGPGPCHPKYNAPKSKYSVVRYCSYHQHAIGPVALSSFDPPWWCPDPPSCFLPRFIFTTEVDLLKVSAITSI